jgi:hypothetical protein
MSARGREDVALGRAWRKSVYPIAFALARYTRLTRSGWRSTPSTALWARSLRNTAVGAVLATARRHS